MLHFLMVARSPKEVGNAIRRRRRDLGLKQVELGKRSKLRQATISALEAGASDTRLRTLFDVLASLEMDITFRPRTVSRRQESSADLDIRRLHAVVRKALRAWSGYETLHAVMQECRGVSVYLVGGALRDLLLPGNRRPKDFDLFLGGSGVEQFIDRLARCGDMTFGPFGSPRWHPSGVSDRYADVVPISRFNNGLWRCDDIVDALNQFDFTANAIALDLRSPRLFDPQNGLRDLRLSIIRAVRFDYPDEPIAQGIGLTRLCVLWFRLIHYARVLGFRVDPVTQRWLNDHSFFSRRADLFAATFFEPYTDGVLA
jgi:transcriptional regulator with XRE-family HTH domain